jgi:hypothetical protein
MFVPIQEKTEQIPEGAFEEDYRLGDYILTGGPMLLGLL